MSSFECNISGSRILTQIFGKSLIIDLELFKIESTIYQLKTLYDLISELEATNPKYMKKLLAVIYAITKDTKRLLRILSE